MGFTFAQWGYITLLVACTLTGSCMANKSWAGYSSNYTSSWGHRHVYHPLNKTDAPNKISVGGSENWHFGFNYSEWALKNGPFYLNDILVFKYDPPKNDSHPHSVYLLPDLTSFKSCNFSHARMLASTTQGGDEGFEFALKSWQPYYFACGESNGIHCNLGGMKFMVMPALRGWNF